MKTLSIAIGLASIGLGSIIYETLVVHNQITVNRYHAGQCFYIEWETFDSPYSRVVKILETQGDYVTEIAVVTPIGMDTLRCNTHFNNFGGTRFHTVKPLKFKELSKIEFERIAEQLIVWRPIQRPPVEHDRRREKKSKKRFGCLVWAL